MKQTIVVRDDLGMGRGKLAAQAAHASLEAADRATDRERRAWKDGGMKKIVLSADSEQQLRELRREADSRGLPTALVQDAGHTQLEPGTVTAIAVGPGEESDVDAVTGHLDLI